MSILQAIVLGIIQGATEFLPVSSSGHLVLGKHLLGLAEMDNVYDIMLHFGTLVAVFIVYWKDIKQLIIEGIKMVGGWCTNIGRFASNKVSKDKDSKEYVSVINSPYRRFVMMIIISTIPTGILGLVLEKFVGGMAESLVLVGVCLLLTCVILLICDEVKTGNKKEDTATYKDSIKIGIVQGIATLPGVSRSGSTITACRLCGFSKEFAVKYSFIMSIPAILGAVVLKLKDIIELGAGDVPYFNYAIGTIVAGVIGYLCIKAMLKIVTNDKFKYFAYYCGTIGIVAIIVSIVNVIRH